MQLCNRLEKSQENRMQNTLLLEMHRAKGEIYFPLFSSFSHHCSTFGPKVELVCRRDASKIASSLFYFSHKMSH